MVESVFTRVIDDLVATASEDPELADGIRWLDAQAQERGISFYDMAFEVLYSHGTLAQSGEWLQSRN